MLAAVALLTWADLYLRVIGPTLHEQHFPTSTYWVAPRLVIEGRAELLFDPPAFADAAEELGANRDRGFIPNAPPAVLPLLPLGLLPEAEAYPIWTLLSVACLILAVVLLVRAFDTRTTVLLGVLAVLPLFHPVRSNITLGQAFAFVLLAITGGAVARSDRWRDSTVAGVSFGFAAVLKLYYGLAVLVPAALERRWRTVGLAVAVLLAASIASLFIVGIDGWVVWIETSLSWRSRPETTVTAYQTLTSLFGHLLRREPGWNELPVAVAPALADGLWWMSAIALATVSVIATRRHSSRPPPGRFPARILLPVALFVPVALITSPIAEDYHYVLALIPLIVAGAVLLIDRPPDRLAWLCFAAAIVLLAPAWPFENQSAGGWSALLFYPRVYGAFVLWLALLSLMGRNKRGAPAVE